MAKDPIEPILKAASKFKDVTQGTSCNQTSFKVGKVAFLFIGPGAKGVGFKAMFKLDESIPQAKKLALKEPNRFQVGKTAWTTVRFTAEKPLPKSIWEKWLKESYKNTLALPLKKKAKKSKKK